MMGVPLGLGFVLWQRRRDRADVIKTPIQLPKGDCPGRAWPDLVSPGRP